MGKNKMNTNVLKLIEQSLDHAEKMCEQLGHPVNKGNIDKIWTSTVLATFSELLIDQIYQDANRIEPRVAIILRNKWAPPQSININQK